MYHNSNKFILFLLTNELCLKDFIETQINQNTQSSRSTEKQRESQELVLFVKFAYSANYVD